jgi:hypothetical protein
VGKNHKRKIIIQEEETQDYNHWRHLKWSMILDTFKVQGLLSQ